MAKQAKTIVDFDFNAIEEEKAEETLEEKKYSHLISYSESFASYQYLIDLISQSINDKGAVKDDATLKLQEIRYSLNQFKNNIRKLLSNIFNYIIIFARYNLHNISLVL